MLLTVLLQLKSSAAQFMTGLQRSHPFIYFWDPFLLLYIKVIFFHICSDLRGRGSELKLSAAVRMSHPVKIRYYFSPLILWQVSWCTWLIVFNLHSQVAYQATDGEIEKKTPHISSTDCASHFATSLLFKQACHELQRIRWMPLLCRDILETWRLWGD